MYIKVTLTLENKYSYTSMQIGSKRQTCPTQHREKKKEGIDF